MADDDGVYATSGAVTCCTMTFGHKAKTMAHTRGSWGRGGGPWASRGQPVERWAGRHAGRLAGRRPGRRPGRVAGGPSGRVPVGVLPEPHGPKILRPRSTRGVFFFSISPGMEPERAQRCALEDKGGSGEDRGFPRPSRATKDWPRARPRATKTRQQPCPAEQSPAPLPAPQSMSVACGPALGAGGRREVHWSAHVNACNIDPRLVTLTLKSKREGTIVSERMPAPFI